MILVKTWKSLLGLFLDKMGLEIMFDDHLVRKQALLDYKKPILSSGHIGFSSAKGLSLAWISDDYSSHFYSLRNVWIRWPLMPSSDVNTPLLLIMQKVNRDFQLANKKMLSGNVYMIQNCYTLLDCKSCLMFKLSTVCGTLNESFCTSIIKLNCNHVMK